MTSFDMFAHTPCLEYLEQRATTKLTVWTVGSHHDVGETTHNIGNIASEHMFDANMQLFSVLYNRCLL